MACFGIKLEHKIGSAFGEPGGTSPPRNLRKHAPSIQIMETDY